MLKVALLLRGQAAPEVKPQEVPTLPPQVNPLGRISEIAMRLGLYPIEYGITLRRFLL